LENIIEREKTKIRLTEVTGDAESLTEENDGSRPR
jgi:hypothetical protein